MTASSSVSVPRPGGATTAFVEGPRPLRGPVGRARPGPGSHRHRRTPDGRLGGLGSDARALGSSRTSAPRPRASSLARKRPMLRPIWDSVVAAVIHPSTASGNRFVRRSAPTMLRCNAACSVSATGPGSARNITTLPRPRCNCIGAKARIGAVASLTDVQRQVS
ncbi:hypothetical protein HBB16_06310 [Pseudonocardia sp. MCCB 268]|nr:hypothetical protein [Pseudonocardia cytotoxica]